MACMLLAQLCNGLSCAPSLIVYPVLGTTHWPGASMWELTAATVQAESWCTEEYAQADGWRDDGGGEYTGPADFRGATDWKFRSFGIQHQGSGYWYSNTLGVCRTRPY